MGIIKLRIDKLLADLANGTPLAHTTAELVTREYARLKGEIQGLLYLETEIRKYRESLEDNEVKEND